MGRGAPGGPRGLGKRHQQRPGAGGSGPAGHALKLAAQPPSLRALGGGLGRRRPAQRCQGAGPSAPCARQPLMVPALHPPRSPCSEPCPAWLKATLTMPALSTRRWRKCEWGLARRRPRRGARNSPPTPAALTRSSLSPSLHPRRMGETNEYFTDWNETYESFDQMQLHENLLRGIYAYGAATSRSAAATLVSAAPCQQAGLPAVPPQRPWDGCLQQRHAVPAARAAGVRPLARGRRR